MARREKLRRTFEKFEASFKRLKEAVSEAFQDRYDKNILIEVVCKRYEYTFESLWKYLREFLLEEGLETNSPLGCFKEAFRLGLIDKKDEAAFPLMVKKRNEIVHVYSDEDAEEICVLIKSSFVGVIEKLFEKIRKREEALDREKK